MLSRDHRFCMSRVQALAQGGPQGCISRTVNIHVYPHDLAVYPVVDVQPENFILLVEAATELLVCARLLPRTALPHPHTPSFPGRCRDHTPGTARYGLRG